MMKPKNRGTGIILSDFVEEKGGFLALTESGLKPHDPQLYNMHENLSNMGKIRKIVGHETNSCHR